MEDLLKKCLYAGVGLVSMTVEQVQNKVEEYVGEGKLNEALNLPSKAEVEALRARVAELEAKLAEKEAGQKTIAKRRVKKDA